MWNIYTKSIIDWQNNGKKSQKLICAETY